MAELAFHDPERWREVVLLAAARVSDAAPMIWVLAEALCYQDVEYEDVTSQNAWGALLAGQALVETANLDMISPRNQPKIQRVKDWLVAILTERQPVETLFPAVERALTGNILAQLGDPRPGVGLQEDGLPDIMWCKISAGSFLMGSDPEKNKDAYTNEQPQHDVYISAFQISHYPVTNAQYRAFIEDGGYTERWKDCWTLEGWEWKEKNAKYGPDNAGGEFDLSNHPVVMICWYEAAAFCQWLTIRLRENSCLTGTQEIRLPTEAEWEKASCGEEQRKYPWGGEISPEFINYSDTGLGATSAVGCFPRGKSPYGSEDMAGNVAEWCLDWYDENYYTHSPKENPVGPTSGSAKIVRGGSWLNIASNCRSTIRNYNPPSFHRSNYLGFRIVRT